MSSESPLTWLGKGKEKRALKLCRKHIDKIVKTTESMEETVRSFCEAGKDTKRKSEKVFKREREADEVKREILNELSKGNFPPLSRDVIIRLATTADDIADNARGAAAKVNLLDSSELNDSLRNNLKTLAGLALEIVRLLEDTYSTLLKDPKATLEKTNRVEKMEEKIDYFRAGNLASRIIEWSNQLCKPGTSGVLYEIENNIEEVADQTENTADIIREIAIRSI